MWRSRLKSLGNTQLLGSLEKAYLKIWGGGGGGVLNLEIYSWISISLVVCVYVAV